MEDLSPSLRGPARISRSRCSSSRAPPAAPSPDGSAGPRGGGQMPPARPPSAHTSGPAGAGKPPAPESAPTAGNDYQQDLLTILSSPAHLIAKNPGALLCSQPSFIAFIVISSEDYLISSECQEHIDLMLKLNNSLNNALGRYFSQPVIFRCLGERSAPCYHTGNRKRKSKNVFLNRFLTQGPCND